MDEFRNNQGEHAMYEPLSQQEEESLRNQLATDRTIVADILNHLQELLWQHDDEAMELDGAVA